MTARPRLLDAFCCAGGATRGYQLAGFEVVGVDIEPQRHYIGDEFVQGDALAFIAEHGHEFDAIHTSPVCRGYSRTQRIRDNDHPMQIAGVRELLAASGRPYVIENVRGAPLIAPMELCGCMFPELGVYRERWFETSFPMLAPPHVPHTEPLAKMGRPPKPGERMHVVGNFSDAAGARRRMGIDWMARDELREAIPPAYTRFIGDALIAAITAGAAA